MQTTSIAGLLPVLIFLVFALVLAIVARRRSRVAGEGGFVKEYFIGNRTLGGFVLAMTTIATYGSASVTATPRKPPTVVKMMTATPKMANPTKYEYPVTASNSFAPPTNCATIVAAKKSTTTTALTLASALEE